METLILILLVANILLMVVFWVHIFSNVDIQFNRLKEKVRDISSKQSDILGAVRTSSNKVEFKTVKPKKWQLTIRDLDSGKKLVYTFKGVWNVFENSIVVWNNIDRQDSQKIASHSLVNRQYDIIECN